MSTTLNRIWRSQNFQRWGIVAIIFLVAFLLRAVYPISRPLVWSDRAFHFIGAVLERNWATTYQQYHPGVTIMWLSGIPLQIVSGLYGGLTADQMLGVAPTTPGALVNALRVSVIPVALVIAACISLTYTLLRRLTNRRIALVGALLIALDPFYIGYSKVIHPDALLATFMIISALFLLVYIREAGWHNLIFSGLFAGLSFLSKSPGLFLVPYAGLVVTGTILARWHQSRRDGNPRLWRRNVWYGLRTLLVWAAMAALIYIILWPAMWVNPVGTVRAVLGGISYHSNELHLNFFNNQLWETDPGIAFYLATIAWKATAVTLPFFVAGILFAVLRYRSSITWPLWALLAYGFFFTIQMGLAHYKQVPYIVPVFPTLNIIAAYGLVWTAEVMGRWRPFRQFPQFDVILIGVAMTAQLFVTLPSYPYFAAHNNHLLGGTQVAQRILPLQDQGEGLEVAARYLNSLPHDRYQTAMMYQRNAIVFRREFEGRTITDTQSYARYRIYYINQLMRELGGEEWRQLWEEDRQKEPLMTVDINGVTYVWVYGDPPGDPANGGPSFDLDYKIGDHIRLKQARINLDTIHPGDTLIVVLYWKSESQINDDYTVFTHLMSAENELVAQQDGVPALGIWPTSTWRDGEELEDPFLIRTDEGLEPGTYTLSIGMYDSDTLQRIPVFDPAGKPVPEDRVIIGKIVVDVEDD